MGRGRNSILMQNSIHCSTIYQALKALPYDRDAGITITGAALDPTQLGDPAHHLPQGRGFGRDYRYAMNATRESVPLRASSSTVQGASGSARATMGAYRMRQAITLYSVKQVVNRYAVPNCFCSI